ncbi:glucose-6-phosphate dehydrogenase [soil metagenome]
MTTERSDALVLFGASGDLARKMVLPALYELSCDGRLDVPVVGVAASRWDDEDFRGYARAAVRDLRPEPARERLDARLSFVSGDYRDPATYERLRAALGGARRPLLYLAIPPSLFAEVVGRLRHAGLHERARIAVEKPFGHDLASARALNRRLRESFPEESVLRVDYFLGLDACLDLLVFRFANVLVDSVWDRAHVARVQVTMAEDFGVETRGAFYDAVGAVRDVVQNHLLQLVALAAMEPPAAHGAGALRDEKVKVLRAMRPLRPGDVVRGQYRGYRGERGVAADSDVETYVALRAWIDNGRWAGVPFYVRTGKRLATTATELVVELRRPPPGAPDTAAAERLRVRLSPRGQVAVGLRTRRAPPGGAWRRGRTTDRAALDLAAGVTELTHDGERSGRGRPEVVAYARLLDAALSGDPALFVRQDEVEASWRVVDPVLASPPQAEEYEPGSWGPPGAAKLVRGHRAWQDPPADA